jgi:hypothetical protein
MRLASREFAVCPDAVVGHQVNVVAAAPQLLRQRHCREEVTSRTSRHQNENAHSAGTIALLPR